MRSPGGYELKGLGEALLLLAWIKVTVFLLSLCRVVLLCDHLLRVSSRWFIDK